VVTGTQQRRGAHADIENKQLVVTVAGPVGLPAEQQADSEQASCAQTETRRQQ
jgi:hypothetical protein